VLYAFDPDAIQTPDRIVAPNLMLDGLAAKKAAYHSSLGLPTGIDLDLIGDRHGPAIVIECRRSPKQPTSVAWLQQCGVAARSVEPPPCREFTQPRTPTTG
jgi:hypothetical protein